MNIYYAILIWIIIWGIISNLTSRKIYTLQGNTESRSMLITAILTFSVIIFFASCRSSVADTYAYIKMFNDFPLMSL